MVRWGKMRGKKVLIDFGSGARRHKVVPANRLVSIMLTPKGAVLSPISFLPREEFEGLQKKWKSVFGTGYLGKFTATSQKEVEERLREAVKFWRGAGFSVVTRDYDIAERVAKIVGGRRETIAVPHKEGGYVCEYAIEEESSKGKKQAKGEGRKGNKKRVKKAKASSKKKKGEILKPAKRQTGKSKDVERDKKLKALPPGKRRSRSGKIYYEYRQNRSDLEGGV